MTYYEAGATYESYCGAVCRVCCHGWMGQIWMKPCADRGKVLGRSKVILSREDLFSVEARHRFGHLSWRELFFVHTITHHFTFLAFFS